MQSKKGGVFFKKERKRIIILFANKSICSIWFPGISKHPGFNLHQKLSPLLPYFVLPSKYAAGVFLDLTISF